VSKRRILCIVGTRPEAVKMVPVILALREDPNVEVSVLATAQHRDILDQVLSLFSIEPDLDLDLMVPGQTLPALSARLLVGLDEALAEAAPDVVLAQGDTTTVLMSALSSFYRQIPFGHVEAGLRTGVIDAPFPEEANRTLTSRLARWHFAPTEGARRNLLAERIDESRIFVTGNTVIDALLLMTAMDVPIGVPLDPAKKLVVVTAHRRENFGEPFREICRALRALADRNDDLQLLYPVHPNPNVSVVAHEVLGGHPRIALCPPLDYGPFVAAMKAAHFIITDSGGVQEEAPALAKPVLVLRNETERPEAVEAGVVRLVGPSYDRIIGAGEELLRDRAAYAAMARGVSPYGDGKAAGRVREALLGGESRRGWAAQSTGADLAGRPPASSNHAPGDAP
jgi:UDP-N-acetylglucosamine 2-epimerase (non-hydrolysing)